MTPLTQQLEDKKKGCGKRWADEGGYSDCGEEDYDLCPVCRAEIAILEQAIAELDKRPTIPEIKELVKKCYADLVKENIDLKSEMQKQRHEEIIWLVSLNHDLKECNIENIYPTEGYRIDEWIKKRIEQLNQLKTER